MVLVHLFYGFSCIKGTCLIKLVVLIPTHLNVLLLAKLKNKTKQKPNCWRIWDSRGQR